MPLKTDSKGVKKTISTVVSLSQEETTEEMARSFGEQREYEASERQLEES